MGHRLGRALVLTVALAAGGTAVAQPEPDPVDPYAGAAPVDDDVTIARALVARAVQLLDAGFPADAKQLAEEALIRAPDGDAAAEAQAIVDAANRALGVVEPQPVPDPTPVPEPTPLPKTDLDTPGRDMVDDPLPAGRTWMGYHGMAMGLTLGAGLGLAIDYDDEDDEAGPGAAIGAAAGIGLGYFAGRWAADRYDLTAPQAGTIGSAAVFGGAIAGVFADVVDVGGTTAREVGLGLSIGTVAGAAGGVLIARANKLTAGDVALLDSFAFYGMVGGLSVGAAMQPAEDEAYSLNVVIGGLGGWLAGAALAPKIDASPRRVSRMFLGAVLGGGLPWLLYAGISDDSTTSDERAIGLASTAGLVAGAYLGYRWTRGMAGEESGTERRKRAPVDDGTVPLPALLRRDKRGSWTVGPALPRTVSVDGGRAWLVDLVGGAF
jgi:hypothetical protein